MVVYSEINRQKKLLLNMAYNKIKVDIARKYFNRYCSNGCLNKRHTPLKIKDKATLGMNMKLYGRQIDRFKCKKCLMKEFGWTKEDWNNKVTEFKEQGCYFNT